MKLTQYWRVDAKRSDGRWKTYLKCKLMRSAELARQRVVCDGDEARMMWVDETA